jgi:hypothetical protein
LPADLSPAAFNFALAHFWASRLRRLEPGGAPVSASTTSATKASTFASIVLPSPVVTQPPFRSARTNLLAKSNSAFAAQAAYVPGLSTSLDQHVSFRLAFLPVSFNAEGAGTTLVEPGLIASRVFGTWLELLANAGIALDAEHVGRSVVQWAIGGTVITIEQVAVPIVFLGRDELGAPAEPIANPFFFQIERSDAFDSSVGIRWRFADAAVLSANALVPLNRQGLRADVIPTLEVECAF